MKLAHMSTDALLDLRKKVDAQLELHRAKLEKSLREFGITNGARGYASPMKGRKVAPKYRGPGGETWAGRGATPKWMRVAMRGTGKKRDDFLIKK